MAYNKRKSYKPVNIFEILSVEEDLTIHTSNLPNYSDPGSTPEISSPHIESSSRNRSESATKISGSYVESSPHIESESITKISSPYIESSPYVESESTAKISSPYTESKFSSGMYNILDSESGSTEEGSEDLSDGKEEETRIEVIDSEWNNNKRKKKEKERKESITNKLIENARIAPVYQIFQVVPDVSDFDILEKITQIDLQYMGNLRIVQDRSLIYGTKVRAIKYFYKIKELGYKGVAMATAAYAPSQITIAWMCAQAGLKFHLFISGCKNKLITPYTQRAIELNATVNLGKTSSFVFRHYPRLKNAETALTHWLSEEKEENWFQLSTGCADDGYMQALVNNIKDIKEKYKLEASEFWVVGITGLIAACLAQVFPESTIHCVSISNSIWPDLFKTNNFEIHQYPINLGGVTTEYPFEIPFLSTPNFGSKVMFFSKKMAPDAIIWNVY